MTSSSDSPAEELSEKEALPPHTSEIGTLKKLPDHGTEWLGSSSGVFFVNTVRRAFSAAFSATTTSEPQSYPASEDILAGGENIVSSPVEKTLANALGKLPPQAVASGLVLSFFRAWHPLFPFLHGPTFLNDMEAIYGASDQPQSKEEPLSTKLGLPNELGDIDIRKAVTLLLIINVASLDSAETVLPSNSRIKSSADVARMAGVLGVRHDIITIQALVASELYLIATRALREASTVGGMLLRNMFHAGLHRCPLRYAQLSPEDCEIRKRIFWSAYALDRHLSQSLGAPLTLQDSDIDTCLSGTRELHKPVTREMIANASREILLHMPSRNPSAKSAQRRGHSIDSNATSDMGETEEKQRREAALRSYVQYGRLTGRVVEIFHKSVHARFPERDAILQLTSDIDAWWNDLPGFLSGEVVADVPAYQTILIPFFNILYQNLLILVNRPALSLPHTSAEFQHGLQVCIKASRTTLSALKMHHEKGLTMFWPGLLAANWMAGLIIAFACQLGKYPVARACSLVSSPLFHVPCPRGHEGPSPDTAYRDITNCLDLLNAIPSQKQYVKQCHLVLSSILKDIKNRRGSADGLVRTSQAESPGPDGAWSAGYNSEPSPKRRKTRRRKGDGAPETAPHQPHEPSQDASRPVSRHDSLDSTMTPPKDSSQAAPFPSLLNMANAAPSWYNSQTWPTSEPTTSGVNQPSLGNSTYADPGTFGLSDSSVPQVPIDATDPNYWSNFDFNIGDVFESAAWENLVGSTEPDMSDWSFRV